MPKRPRSHHPANDIVIAAATRCGRSNPRDQVKRCRPGCRVYEATQRWRSLCRALHDVCYMIEKVVAPWFATTSRTSPLIAMPRERTPSVGVDVRATIPIQILSEITSDQDIGYSRQEKLGPLLGLSFDSSFGVGVADIRLAPIPSRWLPETAPKPRYLI